MPRHGIPEVPMGLDSNLRTFLQAMRTAVLHSYQGMVAARPVTNLTAVPIAGGNKVRFTRSDGEYYVLYFSSTKDLTKATPIDIGISNDWDDIIGAGSVTRYYWVRAKKREVGLDAPEVGPVASTSLAPGTATTLAAAPAPSEIVATDQATGNQTAGHFAGGEWQKEL